MTIDYTDKEKALALQCCLVALMKRHGIVRLVLTKDEFLGSCNALDLFPNDGDGMILEMEKCTHAH